MKWTPVALAAYAGLVTAHGDFGLPNIVGGRDIDGELQHRAAYEPLARDNNGPGHDDSRRRRSKVESRQTSTNGQCGPGIGSCPDMQCCSPSGWCGTTPAYCNAPDCQINYGPGCDGNKVPSGRDTSTIARPKVGAIPYGGLGIYHCVVNGDIAITYDDGPWNYTADLLDIFKQYNAVATFFITGNNVGKGAIDDATKPWPGIIRRMMAEGHQVASHSWSHQNASTLTDAQYRAQFINNEIAFNNILGYFPTYMRPPYSICPTNCQTILTELGYHITYFDLDTQGYLKNSATQIQGSKDIWDAAVNTAVVSAKSFLHIEHDLNYQSVYNLTAYMLASLNSKGFNSVTVGECLGDDPANWYRAVDKAVPSYPPPGLNRTMNNNTLPSAAASSVSSAVGTATANNPASTLKVSTGADCGNGVTCQGSTFGNCCSQFGWCGNTDGHCGTGCQSAFGTCTGSNSTSPSGVVSSVASGTSVSPATGTLKVSTGADCGNGVTCQGSVFGNCCSQFGWCGSTDGHCGAGCQSAFGTCAGSSASSSSSAAVTLPQLSTVTSRGSSTTARTTSSTTSKSSSTSTSKSSSSTPTTVLKATTDGKCGKAAGSTCKDNTKYGPCCGRDNTCGWSCLTLLGCQNAYGACI